MPDDRKVARNLGGALSRALSLLRKLSFRELMLLAMAPVALPSTALGLRLYGLQRVQAFLGRRPGRNTVTDAGARLTVARRMTWIVQAAAAYGPWPANCLQRSVILWWYLRRRGLSGDLRIGVRRDRDSGGLDFHAWIEYQGVVLNDEADIRQRYATFDRAIAPRNATFH